MASNGKKKTTMAKIMRENSVRERRADKQAKKEARKQAARDGVTMPWDVVEPAEGADGTDGMDPAGEARDPVGGAAGEHR